MYLSALCNALYWGYKKPCGQRGLTKTLLRSNNTIILAMKLTAILLFTACLQVSANTYAQVITLNLQNMPLEKVVKEIERQTKVNFFYEEGLFQNAKPVTLSVNNRSLKETLDLSFKNQPFDYKIVGKNVFIRKKTTQATKQVNEEALINVHGRVVNENGEPVEGVTVNEKGTSISVSTNSNGEFFLKNIDDNSTLVFTSVNMEVFEVKVKGRNFLAVSLQTKITAMQEVVINKGYYTEKQKLATGNVVSVKAKDIQNQPVNNPLLALVGRVPGVTIEQSTGFANSGIVVRIQGRNSINSGLDPLYVIDGVPYLSQTLPTVGNANSVLGNSGGDPSTSGGGNPLSFISPNDIESIDILKDADATAIYGSRGANGVILITTKKGKAGQTRVTAMYRSGWGKVGNKVKLLNTDQYLEMRKEAYINDGLPIPSQTTSPSTSNYDLTVWDQNRYTDWQDVLIGGTAKYTDAHLDISGGTANTQFQISNNYHRETTVFPGDFSDKKGSFQFSINHLSNNKKFKIQTSGIYVVDNNEIPGSDLTYAAMNLAPNSPALYNSDGSLNWAPVNIGTGAVSTWTNPISSLLIKYSDEVNNFIGSSLLSYSIAPGLSVSSRFGYTNLQSDDIYTSPLSATLPERRPSTSRFSQFGSGHSSSWIIEPQISYNLSIGKGRVETLVGSSFQKLENKSQSMYGVGYSSDLLLKNISAAPTIIESPTLYSLYKYNAVFGRLNYNYRDRYILNVTVRRDGSSRFGSENQFNNFWSIAGDWIFTNEKLISKKLGFINFGKLGISYGSTGNDQIGDYRFMNLYNPVTGIGVPYQGISALGPTGHTNPYLQWEETRKLQFSLDLGIINDRIHCNLNYYLNRSSNLLVQTKLSNITGFDRITENFDGVVENKGWEFNLTSLNFRKKFFSWTTNFNLTIPIETGKLVSFPNIANTVYADRYTVGRSLYDIKVYHFLGVDPTTGIYQFSDFQGNGTSSPGSKDLIAYGNTFQRLFGGLNNKFSYKGWELDFTFQFVKKNAAIFAGNSPGRFFRGTSGNQPATVLSRWQKPGDVATIQKFSSTYPFSMALAYSNYAYSSDASFTDGSFARLTNLSLSWQLPGDWKKAIYLQNARLFLQAQNLMTITKYKGLDPSSVTLTNISASASTTLPPLRVITLGAQVTF